MDAPELTRERARALRRRMTLPEVLLWQAVRRGKLGVHFRRQHPIGPWILDFYCDRARLAVEVDGAIHGDPVCLERDRRRTLWLATHGIRTFRIPARSVLNDLDGVLVGLRRQLIPPLQGEGDHAKPQAKHDGGGMK